MGRRNVRKIQQQLGPGREREAGDLRLRAKIAVTVSVASPTAILLPMPAPMRAASRVSIQASPRAGMPRGPRPLGMVVRVDERYRAAQRITFGHGLHVGQHRGRIGRVRARHHAVEADRGKRRKAQASGCVGKCVRQRAIAAHHQIGAEQAVRLLRESGLSRGRRRMRRCPTLATASTIATIITRSSPARQSRAVRRSARRSVYRTSVAGHGCVGGRASSVRPIESRRRSQRACPRAAMSCVTSRASSRARGSVETSARRPRCRWRRRDCRWARRPSGSSARRRRRAQWRPAVARRPRAVADSGSCVVPAQPARAIRGPATRASGAPSSSSGSMTFSSAVSAGSNWNDWNTNPRSRARSAARPSWSSVESATPSSTTSPDVGSSSPASKPSSVVLPDPLAPTMATVSRSSMSKVTPSRMVSGASPLRTILERFRAQGSGMRGHFGCTRRLGRSAPWYGARQALVRARRPAGHPTCGRGVQIPEVDDVLHEFAPDRRRTAVVPRTRQAGADQVVSRIRSAAIAGLTVDREFAHVDRSLRWLMRRPCTCGAPLALVVLVASAGCGARGDAPVLLVVGDSISAGYGLARGQGWVDLLAARLARDGYRDRVVNASISGDTTAGGRARLPALFGQHHPAIVVIELGGNDALRGGNLDATRANLDAMVRTASPPRQTGHRRNEGAAQLRPRVRTPVRDTVRRRRHGAQGAGRALRVRGIRRGPSRNSRRTASIRRPPPKRESSTTSGPRSHRCCAKSDRCTAAARTAAAPVDRASIDDLAAFAAGSTCVRPPSSPTITCPAR